MSQMLAPIPGGWTDRRVTVAGRTFSLRVPANPDAFLDDPSIEAEHRRTGYMPYWPYLWSSAGTLAALVLSAPWQVGSRVLEIGCGVGLTGLAALARGDEVLFSDYRFAAVQLALHNARRNGFLHCQGLCFDWRAPLGGPVDVILGSDVIYESALQPALFHLLDQMLSGEGICWLGDPGRQAAQPFLREARQRGWQIRLRDAAGRCAERLVAGEFRLIALRKTDLPSKRWAEGRMRGEQDRHSCLSE